VTSHGDETSKGKTTVDKINGATKAVRTKSKGHSSRKDKNNNNNASGSKPIAEGSAANMEYFCGPCLDEVTCKRQSLSLSEKDIDELKSGPLIYK
jgi:hypothetical protein